MYSKFGTESYTERCELHDIKELLKEVNGVEKSDTPALNLPVVMPRISHFIDENGVTCDLNAEGVNVYLQKDGTFEYYRSFGFAGRKNLTPVYEA